MKKGAVLGFTEGEENWREKMIHYHCVAQGVGGKHAVRGPALFRMKSQRYEAFEASVREKEMRRIKKKKRNLHFDMILIQDASTERQLLCLWV